MKTPICHAAGSLCIWSFRTVKTLKAESECLLEVAKRAVEIAIEQDEQAALDFIARESKNTAEFGEVLLSSAQIINFYG